MKIAWVGLFKSAPYEPQWIGTNQAIEYSEHEFRKYDYRAEDPKYIREEIAVFKPDAIIQSVSDCLENEPYLNDCKYYAGNPLQIFHYVDVRFEIPFPRIESGAIDYMFISNDNTDQKENWKNHIGCKDVVFMPCAYFMDCMWEDDEIIPEIIFIGAKDVRGRAFGQERLNIIEQIRKKEIPLFACGDVWDREHRKNVMEVQPHLYSKYQFALSINSVTNSLEKYTSNRLFNICGAGGIALVKRFDGLDSFYEEGKHIFAFDNVDELKHIFNKYKNADLSKMRHDAWWHTMRNHTWLQRVEEMVEYIGKWL